MNIECKGNYLDDLYSIKVLISNLGEVIEG